MSDGRNTIHPVNDNGEQVDEPLLVNGAKVNPDGSLGDPTLQGLLSEDEYVMDAESTTTIDLTNGSVQWVNLVQDTTFELTGQDTGYTNSATVFLQQDSTGGRAITWPTEILWDGGSEPGFSTNANDLHAVSLLHVNGNWIGFIGGENVA